MQEKVKEILNAFSDIDSDEEEYEQILEKQRAYVMCTKEILSNWYPIHR